MNTIDVRLVTLAPMRLASFYAYGPAPETEALRQLLAWAEPQGYLGHPDHRVFGFNNPGSWSQSPNYGYESWIQVGPEIEPEAGFRVVGFAGGRYAVTRCDGRSADPYAIIPATWQALVVWREASDYRPGGHQWLEEHLEFGPTPEEGLVLDLYLPIQMP